MTMYNKLDEIAKRFAYNSIYANLRTWGMSDFEIKRFIRQHPQLLRNAERNYKKGIMKFIGEKEWEKQKKLDQVLY